MHTATGTRCSPLKEALCTVLVLHLSIRVASQGRYLSRQELKYKRQSILRVCYIHRQMATLQHIGFSSLSIVMLCKNDRFWVPQNMSAYKGSFGISIMRDYKEVRNWSEVSRHTCHRGAGNEKNELNIQDCMHTKDICHIAQSYFSS